MHCVAPSLAVHDIEATVAFYRDTLGFAEGLRIPERDGGTRYATVWNGEATLMFNRIDRVPPEKRSALGAGVTLYIDLGDTMVDEYYRTLTARGVQIIHPLADEYWGARDFTIADPNGYHVTFAQQMVHLTPEQMAENLQRQA